MADLKLSAVRLGNLNEFLLNQLHISNPSLIREINGLLLDHDIVEYFELRPPASEPSSGEGGGMTGCRNKLRLVFHLDDMLVSHQDSESEDSPYCCIDSIRILIELKRKLLSSGKYKEPDYPARILAALDRYLKTRGIQEVPRDDFVGWCIDKMDTSDMADIIHPTTHLEELLELRMIDESDGNLSIPETYCVAS